MKELMNKPIPTVPADILEKLDHPCVTPIPYENKNDFLKESAHSKRWAISSYRPGAG